jgi:hypothetical protein
MASTLTELVLASCELRARAPEAFKTFCDALRAYETNAIVESLAGDESKDLFRSQGKVKTIQELRKHIANCAELRDSYVRRDGNARPSSP